MYTAIMSPKCSAETVLIMFKYWCGRGTYTYEGGTGRGKGREGKGRGDSETGGRILK